MERAAKRNLDSTQQLLERGRIASPNELQRQLTETWILPYQELIIEDVGVLRKEADKSLEKDSEIRQQLRSWDKKYPEGFCREINAAVYDRMMGAMLDRSLPGLQAVKNFIREGGIVQKFWGIDKGRYFQNAIQIGNSILDVANDTVDPSKPPVVFYPNMGEAPLKNIETIAEFADVVESYWDREVYPNIYFPHLAPVFPVLSIMAPRGPVKDEILGFETDNLILAFNNIGTVRDGHLFGLSSDFIFHSTYSDKRIPDAMLANLFESENVRKLQRRRPGGLFEVTDDPEKAREVFASYHYYPGMTEIPKSCTDDFVEQARFARGLERAILAKVRK